MNIADLRQEYMRAGLSEAQADADPLRQFERWFEDALRAKLPLPNAMTLATVTPAGAPSARIVLLKGVEQGAFLFYTNYLSRKGRELEQRARPACCCSGPTSSGRCASTALCKKSLPPSPTPTTRRARSARGSPLGRRRRAQRSPRGRSSKTRWNRHVASMAISRRARRTGAGIAWCRRRSSSGRAAPTACTTVCATGAKASLGH